MSKPPITNTERINPFKATLDGLNLFFAQAQSVAITLLVVSALMVAFNAIMPSPAPNNGSTAADGDAFMRSLAALSMVQIITGVGIIFVICLFILVAWAMLHGIQSYTAARLARGHTVTVNEAFNAVLERFGSYLIMVIWMNLKIAFWSLLFIVPGIIAHYRYSFAGILFFDKDLRANAALKESSRLAKTRLLTVFSSQFLFNAVTLGLITNLVIPASLSILYKKFTDIDDGKSVAPKTHPLAWVGLGIAILITLLYIALILLLTFIADSQPR